jgi:hypothetical protein
MYMTEKGSTLSEVNSQARPSHSIESFYTRRNYSDLGTIIGMTSFIYSRSQI